MIGMLVALAFIFDRPFVGGSQISGGEWSVLQAHFVRDMPPLTAGDQIVAGEGLATCKD
jgi:hypothetical protein